MKKISFCILLLLAGLSTDSLAETRTYQLCYDSPAPNRGKDFSHTVSRGFPYDADWERWSLALGNGYMGTNIFGRTDTERIQISEKTLVNASCYENGGFTNFAECYIDFNHKNYSQYRRTLDLNNGLSTVSYVSNGITYEREYLANYPSNVIAIKLRADKAAALSFDVRGEIPYLKGLPTDKTKKKGDTRTGEIHNVGNRLVLSGKMDYYNLPYEAQISVVNYGGTQQGHDAAAQSRISVTHADSAVIFITAGTAYHLDEGVFSLPPLEKFNRKDNVHPHKAVSQRIRQAEKRGYEAIRAEHLKDYQELFNRVELTLADAIPTESTDQLIHNYQKGIRQPYLEELFFQYGRYMLIASSRPGTLPPNLQGAWTQYDYSPWSGGYWHNVNIQMNYWPAFNTNLAELFEPFVAYNEAYRKAAQEKATEYIKKHNPEKLSDQPGGNGWTIGCGASACGISAPGGHSGPGTGGFTTKLYWDYYDFTRDKKILKEHTYPALEGMALFLSKTLKDDGEGHLLADPSFSPEQYTSKGYYQTKGCTFDQGMIWENFNDLLNGSAILHKQDELTEKVTDIIKQLDPIHIGTDGQLKEYREETHYGSIGDPHHRHISHLCTLYPGTLVNNNTPEWLSAAKIAMNGRGKKAGIYAGWPMAHRMNAYARLKDGNSAFEFYQILLTKGIFENMFGKCPPFQVDSSLGGTAGVAEMLLQSHEGYLYPLPALPEAWKNGSYKGLVARGNFVVDMQWKNGQATRMKITSRKGGCCKIFLKGDATPRIKDAKGHLTAVEKVQTNVFAFNTKKGKSYTIDF